MEHYKISQLLNNSSASKFVTKNLVDFLSSGQYSVNKNIRLKTSVLKSDLYDYSHAYIVVKRTITVKGDNNPKQRNKKK